MCNMTSKLNVMMNIYFVRYQKKILESSAVAAAAAVIAAMKVSHNSVVENFRTKLHNGQKGKLPLSGPQLNP